MNIGNFSIGKLISFIKKFGGGKITTQEEGANIDTNVTKLNFVGASVEVADAGSGVSTITIDADAGYNHWVLEDGDGTEVNITNQKEVKLVEGDGMDINWTDTSHGTDGDPYDMTFSVDLSTVDINALSTVTIANGDYLIIQDVNDSNDPKKGLVSDIATDAAGSDTQIQYNNGGTAFGGIADLTWNDTDVKIGGSSGTTKLLFGDAGTYINQSADAALAVVSDGTVTVDAGTDIVLDADGDDITFKAGSADSTGLKFTQSNTGDWTVLLGTSNKDLIFNVNDGGVATEVCRLDGDVSALKVASSKKLMLGAAEEYVYGDGTDIHFGVGANGDINIPADIGLTFGDDGEKIEGNGSQITITGRNINLTADQDVVIPADVGITFGTGEKIEGNNTDLTVTSGADINLTATGDVNIPSGVGVTFGDDGEKIEGDGTDLTIAGNNINLTAVADVNIPSGVGLTFATTEKIESDGTDLSITVGTAGDINIPANIGLTFGNDGEKIEGDGTDLTIAGNNINLTAVADINIPSGVGLTFATAEKIESDGTDLSITVGAGGDINIPANIGLTFGNDGEKIEGDGTDLTIAGNNINLTATADVVIPADVGITFGTGEKIEGNNTDLTITSGADINLTATADVNIPSGVGVTFGDDGEKIEGNGTDLTIASSNLLNLTATTDVVIPVNVGLHFGDGNEKIESDNTDLTINSGVDINLTATGDVNIPADVGITFGNDGEKIEGDGTDLTISGNNINLTAVADVVIPADVGITFGSGEKIEGNNTDLTVTSGADINLTATGDVNIPADVGVTFGHASADKIEGDGSGMTITSQALDIATTSVSVSSATSEKPEFELKNTNNDANGAILKFNKDGASAADNDVLGSIDFAGENDAVSPGAITYAQISAKSTDVSAGDEDGKIEFIVKNGGADNTLMSLASNTVTIAGDLTVNGTTTHINSTVATIEDPVLNIGGGTDGAAPGSDDNKDRGIEFQYHNGSAAKIGFFGFDDSTSRMVYIPDATNSSEVFSGNRGNIEAAGMYVTTDGSTVGIQIGVTSDTEIDTAAGNLTIDSAGGTTTIDDDCTVSGGLTVNGGDATITAANDAAASILMQADNSDDAGDDWKIIANANQTFTIGNDKASAGSYVAVATLTPHATATSTNFAVAGTLKVGGNVIQASDGGSTITMDTSDNVTIAGDLTVSGNDIKGSGGTAITMDGSNNVTVAADLSVGDDLSLTSDSSVFNMGAGNDFTITHDGTTGATLAGTPISINSTGDLTLDSTTDIVVDAAGGNVEFKDAGTLQLTLDMDTTAGQVDIQLGVDSDDLVFKQYDGNEVIRIADDRKLYFYDQGGEHISSDGSTLTVAGAAVTVDSAADIILDADGGQVTIQDDGADHFLFDCDNTALTIYDDQDTGDLFKIQVAQHGATTISTTDDDSNDDADLTLDADGKIVFEAKAGDEAAFNESGLDVDFRVEAVDETHMIFVEGSSNRVSIGDSTDSPAATLEVTNHASAGAYNVPLIQLNNNDVDQIAIDINAANTTADVFDITADAVTTAKVIDITADALTTGNVIYVDDNSANTGTRNTVELIQNNAAAIAATALKVQSDGGITGVDLDKNFAGTAAATVTGLNIDLDKTAATTSNNTIYGANIDLDNTTATNGTNTMIGVQVTPTLTHAADAGTPTVKGAIITATGGTNGTAVATGMELTSTGADTNNGLIINCADGGTDLKVVSSADTGDYFSISTTTHGATTIATVDDDATAANLTLDIDGDIVLDADGADITFKDAGTAYIKFTQSSGDCIITNGAADKDLIFKDADGNEVCRVDGGSESLLMAGAKKIEFADTNAYIHHDGTDLKIADDADINLVAGADILLDAATTIKIDSAAGDVSFEDAGTAQLAIDMDGTAGQVDIQLKVDSDDLVFKQFDGNEVIRIADDRRLYFYDQGGEYISSDGTDLSIAAGTAINVLAGTLDLSNQAVAVTLAGSETALNIASAQLNVDTTNKRIGIGTTSVETPLHVQTASAPQVRIGYDGSHYADFSLSSAHDLTIKPSSTGQIILQPTTDTTDFFQVLDANGGTSILQVDATNEKVGIGVDPPLVALDVHYKQAAPTSLSNDTGGGEVVYFGGGTTVVGKLYYLDAEGDWTATDADSVDSGAESMLAIALGTAPGTHGMLIRGWFDVHTYLSNFESGMAVFVSTTAGQMDTTSPSGCGDYVRIVGHCTDTANAIYFNPSAVWVEIATS